jgi:integrase
MLDLFDMNPHGPDGFLIYGVSPDSPLDVRAIERGYDNALVRLALGPVFATATTEEKTVALGEWKARNITFHSLRHWSNAMLRGSISDEKLHLLTGHSSERMSLRYDHVTEADLAILSQAQEKKILSVFGNI